MKEETYADRLRHRQVAWIRNLQEALCIKKQDHKTLHKLTKAARQNKLDQLQKSFDNFFFGGNNAK